MKTPIWTKDPTILFKQNHIMKLWPKKDMIIEEKINSISRLVILLTLLSFLLKPQLKILLSGFITLLLIVFLYNFKIKKQNIEKNIENFSNPNLYSNIKHNFNKPTENNPLMNVLLPEIKYKPNRKEAAPSYNPKVEKKINEKTKDMVINNFDNEENIRDKLFNDLGDNFNFEQSMRSWYATPNTEVCNDQNAFAEFLYGDMISCKEGNDLACTRSMPPRWNNY